MYTIIAPAPDNLINAVKSYRQKYDPLTAKIHFNLTLIKPFSFADNRRTELHDHLEQVTERQAPIKVSLAGWDVYTDKYYWLGLPLISGRRACVDLREHLLTGPLQPLADQAADFRPHFVFGRLSTSEALSEAKKTLQGFEPQFVFRVTNIELLQRNTPKETWQIERRFGLKGTVRSRR